MRVEAQPEEAGQRDEKGLGVVAEERSETGTRLCANRDLGLPDVGAEPPEERLDERPTRKPTVRVTAALEPGDPVSAERRELRQESRLPDAGCAREEDDAPAARLEVAYDGLQRLDLAFPAHDRGLGHAGLALLRANELGGPHRLLSPFHGDLDGRTEVEAMHEPAARRLSHENRPRVRGGLQPGGDIRRVAERDGLGIRATDEPHRGRSAVDPDPHGEPRNAPRSLDVSRVALHDLEDAKPGAGGALGVVLVRCGHAEVRADAVALVRLHHPPVLVDGAAHHRDALAYEHLGLVGLQLLAERGRADDVGEENGDGPALVLESARYVDRRGRRRCLRWFARRRLSWERGRGCE